MSKALELMNALQGLYSLKTVADDGGVIVPTYDWQSLRTEVERLEQEIVALIHDNWSLSASLDSAEESVERLEARVARLEGVIRAEAKQVREMFPQFKGYELALEAALNESPTPPSTE